MFNFKVINPSKKKVNEGDIFTWTFDNKNYYFGRVIKMGINAGGFPNSILLYFYKTSVTNYNNIPELKKENLLISPVLTNKKGWFRGFFLTIKNEKFKEGDYFIPHCFKDHALGGYKDENGNKTEYKDGIVCGEFGLASIKYIDNLICDAFGISNAEDD